MSRFVCAVDVGTRSARAALFDSDGRMLPRKAEPFTLHSTATDRGEYRSADIWSAVCRVVKRARLAAGAGPDDVAGLAFDATCSLVLTGADGGSLALGPGGQDTLAWFDRRAEAAAMRATKAGGAVVERLAGAMSPEMQVPRLMWLREERPDLWTRLGGAFDLTDWLTSKAVGSRVHAHACLATKWPYQAENGGWQRSFLDRVGLSDLPDRLALPQEGVPVGRPVGFLTAPAAEAMGLSETVRVGAGLVDGYAGALAGRAIAARHGVKGAASLILGTSASVIAISKSEIRPRSIWGPFQSVIGDDAWSVEGGLSEAGALLDRVIAQCQRNGAVHADHEFVLGEIERHLCRKGYQFADDLHVIPNPVGTRGLPLPGRKGGSVEGLRPDTTDAGLAALYWRTAVAVALNVAEVVARMPTGTVPGRTLVASGGLTSNPMLAQLFANATGCSLFLPVETDGILMGTAMAARVAAGFDVTLEEAGRRLAPQARVLTPDPSAQRALALARQTKRRLETGTATLSRT
jgi:FGGY-family pentulose kinase